MKRNIAILLLFCATTLLPAQTIHTNSPMLDSAFSLAVWTMDHNTHDGILHAGAGYGGEWTRDAAINSLFAASLLRPEVAEKTLWSVTEDSLRIGHQYWDKILWAIAAWHHFTVTGDTRFLSKAYDCASRTMEELEATCFDTTYGLFMGPAVFQDGIEAYPEPIYDPKKWNDSYVLHHPHSDSIRCLSTNAIYTEAYLALEYMARLTEKEGRQYIQKRNALMENIIKHLYDARHHRFYYLIDHQGTKHKYQEGLGVGLALMSDLSNSIDIDKTIRRLKKTPYGLPSVYPSFPRNSKEKPGRHNMMIWPHINAFYALGCAYRQHYGEFYREVETIAQLAMVNGQGSFYEIYTTEGEPSGGWQCGALWDKKEHQTWCATGYLCLCLKGVFGIYPVALNGGSLYIAPLGMKDGSECSLSGLKWRGCDISLTVRGKRSKDIQMKILLNGKPIEGDRLMILPNQGELHYEISYN